MEKHSPLTFPIPLKQNAKYKVQYRNGEESLAPTAPCLGSVNEPNAVEGNRRSVYVSWFPDRAGVAANWLAGWAITAVLRRWARHAET